MADRKTKLIIGAAAAAAAIGAAVMAAKKMHEKGYDKKAVKMLKDWSRKLQSEATKMQSKPQAKKAPAKKKNGKE